MATLARVFRVCALWLALPALAVLPGCRGDSSSPAPPATGSKADAVLEDETWDVVFLKGQRVGYSHAAVYREQRDSQDVLRVECREALTLRSYGNLLRMESEYVSVETPEGQLLEFSSSLPQGGTPMRTVGRVVGDQLQLRVSTSGKTLETAIPWSEQYGGAYGLAGSLKRQPLRPGEARTVRALDVASNQAATTSLRAVDYEETELISGSRRLLRVEMTTEMAGREIQGTLWIDDEGEILKNRVAAILGYESIRATREEALEEVKQVDFDLGRGSAVKVARQLNAPHDTKKIVYRVRLEGADPMKVFSSGPTQELVSKGDGVAEITVHAVRPGAESRSPDGQTGAPTEADLAPNNLIQSDDPTVVAMARQAAGEVKDPWLAAVALEKFVNQRMTTEGISSAFATAAEVARSLTGDCTEHAVLLAALARARGIPARVAIGLVYYRGEFLYHMWTEAFIGGIWIPLDATLGRGGIGAAHLKITGSNLEGAAPQAAFLPVTEVIGQLEIEILDVE